MKSLQRKAGWVPALAASFFTCIFLLTDRGTEVTSAVTMLNAMQGAQIAALCCLMVGTFCYRYVFAIREQRRYALIGGLVFALCDSLGFSIYHWDSLFRPQGRIFGKVLDLACFLGAWLIFYGLLLALFHWLSAHPIRRKETPRTERWFGCNLRSFLLYFGILTGISLVLQVYFYPGITNPDSFTQLSEGLGFMGLTDRHPFLHTLMMAAVVKLGRLLFGTIAGGIAFYTFFQSTLMDLAISFTLVYMARRGIRPGLRIASLVFFALHPAIGCYNITLWKDIWLSYFLMLYVLMLIEAAMNPEHFLRRNSHMAVLCLVILGFLFSKNTGIAVLVGTLPFLFLLAKGSRRRLALAAAVTLGLFGLVRLAVLPQMGIQKGRMSEPLSVPLQQVARTYVYQGDSLTPEQLEILGEVFPLEQLPELYDPALSDNIKLALDESVFSEDVGRYAKVWLDIGRAHPRMYLESFLANSCGYWYPDVIYWVVDPSWYFTSLMPGEEWPFEDPDAENYGVDLSDYGRRHYFVHLYEMLQTVPGVSSLISTAMPFWGAFLLMLICLMKKKKRMLLPLAVVLIVWIICILSPVIAEYRYAFPALVSLPLLTAFTLQDDLCLTEKIGITGRKK